MSFEFLSDFEDVDQSYEQKCEAIALARPDFDYYSHVRLRQPKREIGEYVASHGIPVPLIRTQEEWEQAFDVGTAMLRSEHWQDYDGYSGLLRSEVVDTSLKRYSSFGYEQQSAFVQELGSLILRGLRSGELSGEEYMFMNSMKWPWDIEQVLGCANRFKADFDIPLFAATTSRWRHISGTNTTVFRDPHVDGRYHFGVRPDHGSIGDYTFEKDTYDAPQTFRKHRQPFIAQPFIELYEKVRTLPRFNQNEVPVMEMQQAADGTVYFLQYHKTGQVLNPTEPFDLPQMPSTFYTDNVRGITSSEGEHLRMYCEPTRLHPAMKDQAIFCGYIQPRGDEVQHAAHYARFILDEAYISLKDNHSNSAPLYKPAIAAGLWSSLENTKEIQAKLNTFTESLRGSLRNSDGIVRYIDIHLTSNGHQAAITSDWQPVAVSYRDL